MKSTIYLFRLSSSKGMIMNLRLGKVICCMLIAAITIFTLCACQAESANSQTDQEQDSNLTELKIGVDNLKPFVYLDRNGNYVGVDADIATEACKRAGYKPVFVEIPWANRTEYLENGTVDCLWTAFAIDGRESSYEWTDCYLISKEAFLVQEISPSTCVSDFRGPNGIAVRANSKAEELLLSGELGTSDYLKNVHSYGTFEMAKNAFIKAYANGFVSHRIALEQIIEESPGQYRFLDGELQALHLGVAFSNAKTDYCSTINNALSSMKEDGTLSSIATKYDPDQTSLEIPNES